MVCLREICGFPCSEYLYYNSLASLAGVFLFVHSLIHRLCPSVAGIVLGAEELLKMNKTENACALVRPEHVYIVPDGDTMHAT